MVDSNDIRSYLRDSCCAGGWFNGSTALLQDSCVGGTFKIVGTGVHTPPRPLCQQHVPPSRTAVRGLSSSQLSETWCCEVSDGRRVGLGHLRLEAHRAHHRRLALARCECRCAEAIGIVDDRDGCGGHLHLGRVTLAQSLADHGTRHPHVRYDHTWVGLGLGLGCG
eukprot:scaffold5782_cov36-Phaeocystis_antarctica.AAC.6